MLSLGIFDSEAHSRSAASPVILTAYGGESLIKAYAC